MASAGSLVTGLLSCSPAEALRVPGNEVNNPNIAEEDTYPVSHLPEAVRTAPTHPLSTPASAGAHQSTHSPNSPAAQGLSGDGLLAAHTAVLDWADSPSFLSFLSRGGGRAGSGVL